MKVIEQNHRVGYFDYIMAHLRKRYVQENVIKSLTFSPVVGILGHRQVGKTTLCETIVSNEESASYVTLDSKKNRIMAQEQPEQFLKTHKAKLFVIDEAQKSPDLFDEIKDVVRLNKRPGQFLLTGSIRFTSKKTIRESLTGRILYHELLPFTVSEILHQPVPKIVRTLMQSKHLEGWLSLLPQKAEAAKMRTIKEYEQRGGLPGVFSIRNDAVRKQKINDQLMTILDRDLREVFKTTLSFKEISGLLTQLSLIEGQMFSYSDLQKKTGIPRATIKNLIVAFESLFLIRTLPVQGGKKGFVIYFEDQGECRFLNQARPESYYARAGVIYRNLRAELFYDNANPFEFFYYQTKHNATMPICINWLGSTLAVLPLQEQVASHKEIMAAQSFLKKYEYSKVILLHPEAKTKLFSERIVQLPEHMVF